MLLPDCIEVCSFSTTSPSWMMSGLSLMPVSSENALASVCDSYSWVVMVSETTLISMPLKGSAALANHSSSFFWSSFDSVEGWNSAIHFWMTASSAARTGAETANDTAISAAALDMVRKLLLVNERSLLLNCRMLFLRCSDKLYTGPGWSRIWPFLRGLDRAENEYGRGQRNS